MVFTPTLSPEDDTIFFNRLYDEGCITLSASFFINKRIESVLRNA